MSDRPPLQILLVDDEPPARLRLRQLLHGLQTPLLPLQVVGEAGNAAELDAALAAAPGCQLVLLDIALPGRNGLDLAAALQRLPVPPLVVFVTAHAHHALRAFELEAVDYLTKPVRRERLQAALQRVLRRLGDGTAADGSGGAGTSPSADSAAPVLVVSERGSVLRVPVSEVLYCKAELKYITLVTRSGEWLLDDALSDLEARLGSGFLRVHRNALVALSAVRALERPPLSPDDSAEAADRWVIRLVNGHTLAVSRRQLAAVREVLGRGDGGGSA